VANADFLENQHQSSTEQQASQDEIEITEHLLEYFRVLIEFDDRDRKSREDAVKNNPKTV
jgi:hypothetical protein